MLEILTRSIDYYNCGMIFVIDDKDRKILELLRRNARASYSEIARVIGMSDVAVMKRVKKLEQLGVIKGYTAIVDPRKLGYDSISITGIDVEPEHLFKVTAYLKERDYVKYLALASDDHAVIAVIWARDGDGLSKIHEEIAKLSGVRRVCPSIVLDILKEMA